MKLRHKVLVLASIAFAGLAAGCSSGQGAERGTSVSEGADWLPQTVATKFGEVSLSSRPVRIVALQAQSVDLLSSIDITPVAFYGDGSDPAEYVENTMPWLQGIDTGELSRELKDAQYKPSPEAVANYRPDLIVSTDGAGVDEELYRRLSDIAPTYIPKDSDATWKDTLKDFGTLTGSPEKSNEVIGKTDRQLDAYRKELVNLQGRSFLGAYYTDTGLKMVPNYGWVEDLGLNLAENQPRRGEKAETLSFERIADFSADVAMIFADESQQNKLEAMPGFNELPSVRNSAMIYVERGEVNAAGAPGPSSVEWLMNRIVPKLQKAYGGEK